jgi:hypothetical protein
VREDGLKHVDSFTPQCRWIRAVGNREVRRDVKNVAEGGHDVSRKVRGIVTAQVKRSAISTKYCEEGFIGGLSSIGRHYDVKQQTMTKT